MAKVSKSGQKNQRKKDPEAIRRGLINALSVGISKSEAARKVGCTPTTVSRWLKKPEFAAELEEKKARHYERNAEKWSAFADAESEKMRIVMQYTSDILINQLRDTKKTMDSIDPKTSKHKESRRRYIKKVDIDGHQTDVQIEEEPVMTLSKAVAMWQNVRGVFKEMPKAGIISNNSDESDDDLTKNDHKLLEEFLNEHKR